MRSLETQVAIPVMGEHPVEMGMAGQGGVLAARLGGDACYRRMFTAAFPESGGGIDMTRIAQAIAAFERTLISADSPFDRAARGDAAALSPQARRGQALFFGGRFACASCHAGPAFTDGRFHDVGLYDLDGVGGYPASDHGLREVTGDPRDEGRFRTPGLRNVALTAPYMHDGSIPDLSQAIAAHYGAANPGRDASLGGKGPDAAEQADLVAFLDVLTDPGFVADPRFSFPRRRAENRFR